MRMELEGKLRTDHRASKTGSEVSHHSRNYHFNSLEGEKETVETTD